jgi:hypothetical protein
MRQGEVKGSRRWKPWEEGLVAVILGKRGAQTHPFRF